MDLHDIQVDRDIFLSDLGCIYLADIRAAVVSDLHLGFEEEMNLHGLFLPKMQLAHIEKSIDAIMDRYSPEMLIINGDFKHEFSRNLPQEWDDVIHFVDRYQKAVDLKFIRGNHDNFLLTMLARRGLELPEFLETDRYYIYHGDKERGLRKITILGHEHPSIVLRDEIGGVLKIPAFVHNRDAGILITPALSFFSSGTDVTQSLLSDEHFTPVLKNVDARKFRVYGLTEEFGLADFGFLGDLQKGKDASGPS